MRIVTVWRLSPETKGVDLLHGHRSTHRTNVVEQSREIRDVTMVCFKFKLVGERGTGSLRKENTVSIVKTLLGEVDGRNVYSTLVIYCK